MILFVTGLNITEHTEFISWWTLLAFITMMPLVHLVSIGIEVYFTNYDETE